ncbi:MAG: type IX secretion system PorP/SprF family membrane protein [Vicingaceae bacterium]|jgi:type IX secretion system PorP/SprF family membrane protein
MKKVLIAVVCLLSVFEMSAQQDPQFTQNMFNRLSVNPAYAGAKESFCATLISREQWLGFEGNPQTNLLSLDYGRTIKGKHKVGAGLTVIQDEIGPEQSLNVKLALAYHKRIMQGVLSAGIELGIYNKSISANWRTSEGAFDGTEDPKIPNSEAGSTVFDLGVGVYYYRKNMYVGLSSTHLNQSVISDDPDETSSLTYTKARHYYAMGGYNYTTTLNGRKFEIMPSFFVKSDAISTQVDLNTNFKYDDLIWVGTSYRIQDAVSLLAGVDFAGLQLGGQFDNIKVGLAYDYNISDLSTYNNGSVEFMINYCYKFVKNEKVERYKSVRFL